MKKLYIIDDRRPLWSDIALTLEEMNAEIHILTREETERAFEKERPDLLVLGEQSLDAVPEAAKNLTKIVLSDEAPAGDVIHARRSRKVSIGPFITGQASDMTITNSEIVSRTSNNVKPH